jgi:hypothetical protein
MSDTGLYSGLYTKVRDVAALIDEVLMSAKLGSSCSTDSERNKLGYLLAAFAAPTDWPTNYLSVVIKDIRAGLDLKSLASTLRTSESLSSTVIGDLELLASTLESERARMLTKMRGR